MTALDAVEAAWVRGLRSGSTEAFDQVYARYRPRIFSFLVRLSGQRPLAEDLLQETFLRLARKGRSLSKDTRLGPWLYTVSRNLYLSHRRWMLLDADRRKTLKEGPQNQPLSPFEAAAGTQLQAQLERAIAALPLKYREVLLLVAKAQLTPSEAAQVLKIKPDAVRQRLARARAMMKTRLEGSASHG